MHGRGRWRTTDSRNRQAAWQAGSTPASLGRRSRRAPRNRGTLHVELLIWYSDCSNTKRIREDSRAHPQGNMPHAGQQRLASSTRTTASTRALSATQPSSSALNTVTESKTRRTRHIKPAVIRLVMIAGAVVSGAACLTRASYCWERSAARRRDGDGGTYTLVSGLLGLVALLVDAGLLVVRLALLVGELLPLLPENLANVACGGQRDGRDGSIRYIPNLMPGFSSRTLSRLSLAKNMYADRPRFGALGSGALVEERRLKGETYPSCASASSPWSYAWLPWA
jgi:hypothetical protein